jgi:putative tryptophan/tyrosine transport system substrate-binding protein
MRRRAALALIGAAVTCSRQGKAQAPGEMRRVGVMMGTAEADPEGQARVAAFRKGLQAFGRVEGSNLRIVARWAAGDPARSRALAVELIATNPEVVLANSGPVVEALQRASSRVPIVFVQLVDPVGRGLVNSLARPGRNLTGLTHFEPAMGGKWLALLKEIAPRTERVAFLYNPETASRGAGSGVYVQSFESFAAALAIRPVMLRAQHASELRDALDAFARDPNGAVLIPPDIFNTMHRGAILETLARNRLPAIFPYRFYVAEGGLMSYGVDLLDLYRGAAAYVHRILKGENPAEMPVQQPTRFELVINTATAKAIGLTIPPTLLARADEVIE